MSSVTVKFAKNKTVRTALRNALQPLIDNGTLKSVDVHDADYRDARHLPAVCVFFEDGDSEYEQLDQFKPKMTTAALTIKIKAKLDNTGDDKLDDIADACTSELDKDLTLGGLLDDEILFDSFAYLRDPNEIYTVLVLSAEIKFNQ